MMQITVDPSGLSQEQREAVAGFILAYPAKKCAGTCAPKDDGGTRELEQLSHDHESTLPEAAFGVHGSPALDADAAKLNATFGEGAAGPTAADVFGKGSASPLPVGAIPAPSIAGAAPLPTAPAAPLATSTPPTAPVPPAPTAPTVAAPTAPAAPTTHAGGVELDKHGLPWDGRIHAGTKRKNADGSWTAKRGVDPALVATVEAELRQVMGAAPAAPLAPAVPAPPPTAPIAPVVASAPQVTAPPAPAVAPAAAPGEVPADARAQFVALVGRASAAIQGQKVTQAEVNQCCVDAGVPALPLLANRLDLVAQVAAHIDALIAARQ